MVEFPWAAGLRTHRAARSGQYLYQGAVTSWAWHPCPVVDVARERFEELVADALDEVPAELTALMDNVVVLVEDHPPPGDPGLLGLYEGISLTERDSWYSGVLPDRITLYRMPICTGCGTEEEVVDEVAVTVVHEIAHHFGIEEHRLHELGWG